MTNTKLKIDGTRFRINGALTCLYPETIDFVDFYLNDALVYTCYDDPFTLNFNSNWHQGPWLVQPDDREWKAVIHLVNGESIEKTGTAVETMS